MHAECSIPRLFSDSCGKKYILSGLNGNILAAQMPKKAKAVCH